jgi:hypothetical protein
MKSAYRVLAGLICLLVLVQSASIALGTFGIIHFVEGGNDYTKAVGETGAGAAEAGGIGQSIHSIGATAVTLVAIILLVVAFLAKIEDGLKWAVIVFVAVLLQWGFAIAAFQAPVVGLLHGVNAFVIFGTAMTAMQKAKASTAAPVEPAAA